MHNGSWLHAIPEAGIKEISPPRGVCNVFACTAPAEPSEHRLVLFCLQGAAQLCSYIPLMMGKTGSKYLCYKTTYGLSVGDDTSPGYLSSECTFPPACLYPQECCLAAQVSHSCQERCQFQEKALMQVLLLIRVMHGG